MSLDHHQGPDARAMPRVMAGLPPADVGNVVATAISEQIVHLYLESFGRGPTRARTYVQPQFAVCVLGDVLTTAERSLIGSGGSLEVEAARGKVNETIDHQYVSIVELQTRRPVLSHLARVKAPVDIAVHFFLLGDAPGARDAVDR